MNEQAIHRKIGSHLNPNPFGGIGSTLRTYVEDTSSTPSQIDVRVNSKNWVQACLDGILQRKRVRIIHQGPYAEIIVDVFRRVVDGNPPPFDSPGGAAPAGGPKPQSSPNQRSD